MKKLLMSLAILLLAVNVQAGDYRYVAPEQMKTWLESGKELVIVDIQPAKDFARQHFSGALETNAFPAEKPEEQKLLAPAVESAKANSRDVVVVCPRGKGGAKRTYDYLKANGVAEERIFILTDGMDKWPYPELVKSN
jgi:rhodanese-related sulfurtransferase